MSVIWGAAFYGHQVLTVRSLFGSAPSKETEAFLLPYSLAVASRLDQIMHIYPPPL